jgi:hypothetical protein
MPTLCGRRPEGEIINVFQAALAVVILTDASCHLDYECAGD